MTTVRFWLTEAGERLTDEILPAYLRALDAEAGARETTGNERSDRHDDD